MNKPKRITGSLYIQNFYILIIYRVRSGGLVAKASMWEPRGSRIDSLDPQP